MEDKTVTEVQERVLVRAYNRGGHYPVCPTPGLWGASKGAVLRSLQRDGYITRDSVPVLTELGKAHASTLIHGTESQKKANNY